MHMLFLFSDTGMPPTRALPTRGAGPRDSTLACALGALSSYAVIRCTILYYTIPYYTILYYTILHYTILYYTIL